MRRKGGREIGKKKKTRNKQMSMNCILTMFLQNNGKFRIRLVWSYIARAKGHQLKFIACFQSIVK